MLSIQRIIYKASIRRSFKKLLRKGWELAKEYNPDVSRTDRERIAYEDVKRYLGEKAIQSNLYQDSELRALEVQLLSEAPKVISRFPD